MDMKLGLYKDVDSICLAQDMAMYRDIMNLEMLLHASGFLREVRLDILEGKQKPLTM
jgi:hypothetical protein